MPPGDFTEAQDFWGTSGITNGNGDGKILSAEMTGALKHLAEGELANHNTDSKGYYSLKSFSEASVRIMNQTQGGFNYAEPKNLLLIGKNPYAEQQYLLPEQSYRVDKKIEMDYRNLES